MRILQIITPARIAGAERSTMSLCEHLQAAGHEVIVGCKQGSPLVDEMRRIGLDVRPLAISGKANLAASFRIANLARKERVAVIHSHLSSAAFHSSLAGRIAGLPSIAHVRALNRPFWYSFATRAIAVSCAVKDHLVERGMNAGRVDVVYNGVDPARYFNPCSQAEARERVGLPAGVPIALVVAHLSRRKGHPVFLHGFARAAKQHPDALAVLLGQSEPEERAALEREVEALGIGKRVVFAGFHSDVLPYYAAADVVVLPSIEGEGLPRALLEGGMLGRPTIGTRLSGVPEIIRDEVSGFIVPINDAEAIGDRLALLFGDPSLRERMGREGHAYVSQTFTTTAMVEGTVTTYRKAGAGNGNAPP